MKLFYKSMLSTLVLFSSTLVATAGDLTPRADRSELPLNSKVEVLTPLNVDITPLPASLKKTPAEKPGYTYLGTGKWKDDLFSVAILDTKNAGLEWDVEIYESNDTKGKYLVANPYGDCPINLIPKGEYSDVIFHTEKANLVYMEYTDMKMKIQHSGKNKAVKLGSTMGRWVSLGMDPEDVVDMAEPGTLKDGAITFPKDEMLIELAGTRYTTNRNGLFQLLLPKAEDMSVELTAPTCVDNDTFDFSVKAGKDVSSVKYQIIPAILKLDDTSGAMVASKGTKLESNSGNWSVTLNKVELNNFYYTLIVVACNKEGKYVNGRVAWMVHSANNEAEWKDLCKAQYTDDIISSIYSFSQADDKNATYGVTVQENVNTPGLFRIREPYGKGTYYEIFNKHDVKHPHFLIINASDPNKIEVNPSAIGFEGGGSGFYVMSTAAALLENGSKEEEVAKYYGKYDKENGIITIPTEGIVYGDTKEPNKLYMANASGLFKLKFGPKAGLNDIISDIDSNVPAEYFDLYGRKIVNPTAPGVYIMRRGEIATKIVIR